MKRVAVVGASALILSGCALPIPLQVASWMLDGISVLATEKSVADHGISIATQSDCAVWRGVVDGEFCRDWDQGETLVASAELPAATPEVGETLRQSLAAAAGSENPSHASKTIKAEALSPVASGAVVVAVEEVEIENLDIDKLANFETAAGDDSVVGSIEIPSLPALDLMPELAPIVATFAPLAEPTIEVAEPTIEVAEPTIEVAEPVRVAAKLARKVAKSKVAKSQSEVAPEAGIYFVIGSFRSHGNAKVLAGRHEGFVPEVLAAKLDGAPVYRVVVGPIANGGEKTAHRRLARAGLVDTWAIRVVPEDWQLASAIIDSRTR